eukprot:1540089-Rhodomonas_salina.2
MPATAAWFCGGCAVRRAVLTQSCHTGFRTRRTEAKHCTNNAYCNPKSTCQPAPPASGDRTSPDNVEPNRLLHFTPTTCFFTLSEEIARVSSCFNAACRLFADILAGATAFVIVLSDKLDSLRKSDHAPPGSRSIG